MDQLKFDSEEFLKLGEEQPQANRLAAYLIQQYHPSSIVDVGAATGLYLKPFLEKGVYVQGWELEPIPKSIAAIDSRFLHRIDITREIAGFGFRYSYLLCGITRPRWIRPYQLSTQGLLV